MTLLNHIACRNSGVLMYRHPCEQFSSLSVLHVEINQCAVFVRNGVIAGEVLEPGEYIMDSENIPFLERFVQYFVWNRLRMFRAQIYFFNTSYVTNLRFGTSMTICEHLVFRFHSEDGEVLPIPVKAGIFGRYHLQISDPVLLLRTLFADGVTLNRDHVERYFRSLMVSRIIPVLREIIDRERISIFDLERHMGRFSAEAQKAVSPDFEEIGLRLLRINIEGFRAEKDDPGYEELLKIRLYEGPSILKAGVDARVNRILGTTYQEKEEYRIKEQIYRQRICPGNTERSHICNAEDVLRR